MLEEKILPMLAYSSSPLDSLKHIFEIKWDGTRCILFLKDKEIRLQNRRLLDITARYPELSAIHREIRAKNAILDGELVVLSEGKPDFNKLQEREHLTDPLKIDLLSQKMPANFIVFDILFLNGSSYLQASLLERKETLKAVFQGSKYLIESEYIHGHGRDYYEKVIGLGFEGVMAKAVESPYLIGQRSRYWLKIKPRISAVCSIIGYLKGGGSRQPYFGSLALAAWEDGKWVYRGNVGSGFTEAEIKELFVRLCVLKTDFPSLVNIEGVKDIQWVKPELRCEVLFQEMTPRGHFRAPAFKKLWE
jgi:bifunctional non-homologous end joining protein LigD